MAAVKAKVKGRQAKEGRGILDRTLRFLRIRPSRPVVTVAPPPSEKDEIIQRLINTSILSPYPVTTPTQAESKHEVAEEAVSQASTVPAPAYHPPKRQSVYCLTGGLESSSTMMSTEVDSSGPRVVMVSPYRKSQSVKDGDTVQSIPFSEEALINMSHGVHHLSLDLFRPEGDAAGIISESVLIHQLSPLCLYRNLRSLSIIGMNHNYPSYVWMAIGINPHLEELTLEMTEPGGTIDTEAIKDALEDAESKPSMQEIARGQNKAQVSQKIRIVSLNLTNFVVDNRSLECFSGGTIRHLRLHRCDTSGFSLPEGMRGRVELTITH